MKKLKWYLQPIYWVYVYIPIVLVSIGLVFLYYRVAGDLEVCRLYYPEMSRLACYMSSKTVRVPSGW